MTMSPHLADALSEVRQDKERTQITIFDAHASDIEELILAGCTLAEIIRVIKKLEPPKAVKPQGMRKAFNRKYESWSSYCDAFRSNRKGCAPAQSIPDEDRHQSNQIDRTENLFDTKDGIRDQRSFGKEWG